METSHHGYIKIIILLVLIAILFYYLLIKTNTYELKNTFKVFHHILNQSRIMEMLIPVSNATILNRIGNITNRTTTTTTTTKRSVITTKTTGRPTTIDPAELLVERSPSAARLNAKVPTGGLAVFLFQTEHHVLADLQLYLIRKLAIDLVALELFVDRPPTQNMRNVALAHKAGLHSFPVEQHKPNAGGSDRNTDIVNWAISLKAKQYLGNGTAILLLDGDVFPLSPFDSVTLLNSRDVVCRKHPALFARFCWIGFICLGPQLYGTIDHFDVSQTVRQGKSYDSGGKTIEYFLKYENASFSWMRETIFLGTDKNLFWGAMDRDIQWIRENFRRCDKCGPEIFLSPFDVSNAVFYHMISATSEWRFEYQDDRRKSIHKSIMRSPYGPNKTYLMSDMIASVRKVQQMELIPFFGDLTCERVCRG
ncbi:unnamed protein product [Adineta steineri]|uniref:Uncharacterized protein n=1 Tax=Adineta steineri TaxID=433720 RepID=A0A818LV37_9BILA|nr:unnamed protein product [Adineta steineri]CAF3570945.1 unnamed protein product [Adineta steineri]